MEHKHEIQGAPTQPKERYVILDAWRGFALLGIALANFPEFSLWTFLSAEQKSALPTASWDGWVRYVEYFLVEGKFYTIFSVLFGIGFSIIIEHAARRGVNGFRIFYRRMLLLFLIGMAHMMLLWSGDILALYAAMGMLLPLFRKLSDRWLLGIAGGLLLLPVLVDGFTEACGWHPSAWFQGRMQHYCDLYGITEERYATWLQEQTSYVGVLQFLVQGACVRMMEFIEGNRYFRVMGLFLIGLYAGRHRLYADLESRAGTLLRFACRLLLMGLPVAVFYAYSGVNHQPWGITVHSMLYTFSVFPMGFAYMALMALWHAGHRRQRIFPLLAAAGRMALTCYIGQSVLGMLLFYGIGFGMGASMGLCWVFLIAIGVYCAEVLFARVWFRWFQYGPLEWVWRMLTYGRYLPIRIQP